MLRDTGMNLIGICLAC